MSELASAVAEPSQDPFAGLSACVVMIEDEAETWLGNDDDLVDDEDADGDDSEAGME